LWKILHVSALNSNYTLLVYQNEFGHAHKLTVDAKRRLDKLQTDLLKP